MCENNFPLGTHPTFAWREKWLRRKRKDRDGEDNKLLPISLLVYEFRYSHRCRFESSFFNFQLLFFLKFRLRAQFRKFFGFISPLSDRYFSRNFSSFYDDLFSFPWRSDEIVTHFFHIVHFLWHRSQVHAGEANYDDATWQKIQIPKKWNFRSECGTGKEREEKRMIPKKRGGGEVSIKPCLQTEFEHLTRGARTRYPENHPRSNKPFSYRSIWMPRSEVQE